MATQKNGKTLIIKIARVLTYLVYAYLIIAIIFLVLGFLLLLFGASTDASFTRFVYQAADNFLEPFRNIFPTHQINSTSYFSAAGLFAIIFYSIVAFCTHALIEWITLKLRKSELELQKAIEANKPVRQTAVQPKRS